MIAIRAAAILIGLLIFRSGWAAEDEFRAIYRDLVETDTTFSRGSCTVAAQKMADRLTAAGYAASDVVLFGVPEHPREKGLFAVLRASHKTARKGVLYLAHIDVVEVDRTQWQRDPFTLTEDNGWFYGRGVSDDKAMAAALIETLIRLKQARFRPGRDVKIALTCGEETATAFNGAAYLAAQRHDLIAADFALLPTGGGQLGEDGRPRIVTVQVAEKLSQSYRLVATGPGGHSSRPLARNAITALATAIKSIGNHQFPIHLTPAARSYFANLAPLEAGSRRELLEGLVAAPDDPDRLSAVAAADPVWNALLRTTCTPTLLDGGQALNALPERAMATINCRLLPGEREADLAATLRDLIAGTDVTLVPVGAPEPRAAPATVGPSVLKPIIRLAGTLWPGVAVLPALLTGATDARHLNAAGIPAFGVTLVMNTADGDGVHSHDERVRTQAVMQGRAFLFRLMTVYAD